MIRHPPRSPLFPYTPLSRSAKDGIPPRDAWMLECVQADPNDPQPCSAEDRLKFGASVAPSQGATEATKTATAAGTKTSTATEDRKSTRLNSSHLVISYAVFC